MLDLEAEAFAEEKSLKRAVRVQLSNRDQFALVDPEDYELVGQFRWHACQKPSEKTAYARTKRYNRPIAMHQLVMGIDTRNKPVPRIDHRNRNGLDNRRRNLRFATASQNNVNRPPDPGYSSKYKGVHLVGKRWIATVSKNGGRVVVGRFAMEEDAALAYDLAVIETHGEFAYLNFPRKVVAVLRGDLPRPE